MQLYRCVHCDVYWFDDGKDIKGYRCPECDEPGKKCDANACQCLGENRKPLNKCNECPR